MPSLSPAFEFLEREWAPTVAPIASMLYVGHRGDTHPWWRTSFRVALGGPEIAVIDIQRGNLDTASGFTPSLICGDIRGADVRGYGVVFWDEGPEHVPREDALAAIARLAERNSVVLVSCPWGHQPQGTGPSDPEFHHWGPEREDFESIGMSVRCFGTRFHDGGQGHGNIIAWTA